MVSPWVDSVQVGGGSRNASALGGNVLVRTALEDENHLEAAAEFLGSRVSGGAVEVWLVP